VTFKFKQGIELYLGLPKEKYRDQFLATRSGTTFAGYPDPAATLGEVLRGEAGGAGAGPGRAGPGAGPGGVPNGRILVSHLGVGLADVLFAAAVLERAEQLGLGRLLPR
jgi:hypothetical protein